MTTTTAPATLIPIEPPLLPTLDFLYRFTRDQFHEMERLGIRGEIEDYDCQHPKPEDIGIAIEVSNTSLRFDRREKGAKYAEYSIPCYWVLNVVDRQIEVYSDPEAFKTPAAYVTQAIYKPGDAVPIVLDGQTVATIPVEELLP